MHHFVTKMCTCVHISVTKWCIVRQGTGALWADSWDGSMHTMLVTRMIYLPSTHRHIHIYVQIHIYKNVRPYPWYTPSHAEQAMWPSDAIWWYRHGSTLAQVMACCLTAPIHYLNQCWLITSEVLWHSHEDNFTRNAEGIYPWYEFESVQATITVASPRGQWVNEAKS